MTSRAATGRLRRIINGLLALAVSGIGVTAGTTASLVAQAAPAAATRLDPGPPPPACTQFFTKWPNVHETTPDQTPCYIAVDSWGGRQHVAEAPGWLRVGQTRTFTVEETPDTLEPDEAAFTFDWNNLFDIEPILRSADGRAANTIIGWQDVYLVPPQFDMSGCRQPGSTNYDTGRIVHECRITLLRGGVYNTPVGSPIPWMLLGANQYRGWRTPNIIGPPFDVYAPWGMFETPVLIEPSPFAGFSTAQTGARTFRFDGSASLYNGTIDQYHWFFGDGTEAYGKAVNHTYDPTATTVSPQLMITADGQQSSAFATLDVTPRRALDMDAAIALSDDTPAIGDVITATFTVRNTGDVATQNVVLNPRSTASAVLGKVGLPSPASASIVPGGSATFAQRFKYKGGQAAIEGKATGTTSESPPISLTTPTRRLDVGGPGEMTMSIDVTPDLQFDLSPDAHGEPIAQAFTADVTVRNTTNENVTSATLGALTLGTTDDPAPVAEDRAAGWPDDDLGPFAAGETKTVTYHLKAQYQGRTDIGASVDATTASSRHSTASRVAIVHVDEHNPATVTWSIDKRYDNSGDEATTVAEVNPGHWGFTASYKLNGKCPKNTTAEWTVEAVPVGTSAIGKCDVAFDRPDVDPYRLQAKIIRGTQQIGRRVEGIKARDLLVVSVGDSLSSGEGVMETTGWRHAPCHRSSLAGPARGARLLEDKDPHSTVTFVHLACSGAGIDKGLLVGYDGVTHTGNEPPQLRRGLTLAGSRQVDAWVMSIGINDIGFGKVAEHCLKLPDCQTWKISNGTTNVKLDAFLANRAVKLHDSYDRLAARMIQLGIPADRVHIVEYPDELHGDDGLPADYHEWSSCLAPVPVPVALDPGETAFLVPHFEDALRAEVSGAASRNGWKVATGMFDQFFLHGLDNDTQDTWFMSASRSCAQQGDKEGTLHPNAKGHRVYGDIIYNELLTEFEIT